jgi:DNA-binding transcriptional ArsR family regulator
MTHLSALGVDGDLSVAEEAEVFRALADSSRRLLLDSLFASDGQTLGELASRLSGMTRFGVMKHLRILESAGLVSSRKVGRERFHYLNALPVRLVHERWMAKYTGAQTFEIAIRATPEEVRKAIGEGFAEGVNWQIEALGELSRLTVADVSGRSTHWAMVLGSLKSLVETGHHDLRP